jgi:hypothetical protein
MPFGHCLEDAVPGMGESDWFLPNLDVIFRIQKQGAEIAMLKGDWATGQYVLHRGIQFLLDPQFQFDTVYRPPEPEHTQKAESDRSVATQETIGDICEDESASASTQYSMKQTFMHRSSAEQESMVSRLSQ